jgi:hypothetical protein
VKRDDPDRGFLLAMALIEGGIEFLRAWTLVADETGSAAWADALQRLVNGGMIHDCIPGLPSTLRPIVRWSERNGQIELVLPHVRDFWSRPLDRRVPFFFLSQATRSATLREALAGAPEFAVCHPEWKTLGDAQDPAEAAPECRGLFPAPLGEAVAVAGRQKGLPSVFAALGRACDAGLMPLDGQSDRSSSIKHGLFSLSLLLAAGVPLEAALTTTAPAIRDEETRKQFAALRAETFTEAPMPFLSAPAAAVYIRATHAGDLAETLEYIAKRLVDL